MQHSLADPQTWLESHGDSLYRYALARTGDPARAEDLVQDTLMAALESREGYAGSARERTWLTGILRHKVIDHLRVRQRELPMEFDPDREPAVEPNFDERGSWQQPVSAWGNPDGALRQDQFMATLEACVEELPVRAAEAFRLRELHGFETGEICEVLEIATSANLFVILSRARMRLRDCLGKHWFEAEESSC